MSQAAVLEEIAQRYRWRRLLISFSGGRTSAYMLALLLTWNQFWLLLTGEPLWDEIVVIFSNTGQEHELTLVFVDRCDREWNAGIVYVEAVVDPIHGNATTHRVVDFATATRGGSIFDSVIAKYGIPNATYLHCNRELKLRPIHDYAQSVLGWEKGSYDTAIGIRADEADRQNARAKEERLIYPLIKLGVKRPQIMRWWRRQPFDLELAGAHLGNCVWCWKKTLRKHLTLAKENPEVFAFPAEMEAKYPFAGANADGQPRRFFRKNWTTLDIFARARQPFVPYRDDLVADDPELDRSNGCDEACDITASLTDQTWDLFGEAA